MSLLLFLLAAVSVINISAQSGGVSVASEGQAHVRNAQGFLNQGKPELAAAEYAAAIALDPHNIDAQGNLGVLLFFKQDYTQAEPHLRIALRDRPDLVKIRALLGMCEKHLGEIELARNDLEATAFSLKDSKIQIEAGLQLIEIYSAAGELETAARTLSTLRAVAPTEPRVLYAAYRIYSDLAGEAMLDLSVAAPGSGQMHQAIAHDLYRGGNLAGAIANFQRAVAADSHLPGIHFELAEAFHASPDPALRARADAEYKVSLVENPKEEKAWTRLGDIATEKGSLDEAAADYTRATQIQPADTDAAIGMARVFLDKNDPAAAASLLEKVVQGDPTNILALYRLSAVYRRLNRPEDARRELEAYQKYKSIKEQLRTIYKEMRVDPKGTQDNP